MAVQLESAARLAALRDKADAVTGESSATLAGAVDALIAGFGSGDGADLEELQAAEDQFLGASDGYGSRRIPGGVYSNNRITKIAAYAFVNTQNMISFDLPNVTEVFSSAFDRVNTYYGDSISIVMPSVLKVGENSFQSSYILYYDFPKIESIGNQAFQYTRGAVTLIIRNTEKMCTLAKATRLFDAGSGWKDGTYIYVPKKFLSDDDSTMDYRRATNWVTYAAIFRALEDYTVDGTTTGELDPNKI